MKNYGFFLFLTFIILFSNAYINKIECKEIQAILQFINYGYSSPKLPLSQTSKDIFNEKWSDRSILTLNGMKQMFNIGQKLRKYLMRNTKLIDTHYNNNKINAFTLNGKNSILSLYLLLKGLYPPPYGRKLEKQEIKMTESKLDYYNSDKLYSDLKTDSIPQNAMQFPIVSFPPENHYFGLNNPDVCKGVKKEIEKNKHHKNVKILLSDFEKKYSEDLIAALKLNRTDFKNYDKYYEICTSYTRGFFDFRDFKILNSTNIDKKEIFKDCQDLIKMHLFEVIHGDKDKLVSRIAMSKIMRKIFKFLDQKIKTLIFEHNLNAKIKNNNFEDFPLPKEKLLANDSKILKMYQKQYISENENLAKDLKNYILYSGEQADLASFLSFFNIVFNTTLEYPDLGSNIFIELVQNRTEIKMEDLHLSHSELLGKEDFYVNMIEKESRVMYSEKNFEIYIFFNKNTLLKIPYSDFKKKINKKLITDEFISDFCEFEEDYNLLFKIAALVLFIACSLIGVWIYKLLKKPKRPEKYDAFSEEGDLDKNLIREEEDKNYNSNYNTNPKNNNTNLNNNPVVRSSANTENIEHRQV